MGSESLEFEGLLLPLLREKSALKLRGKAAAGGALGREKEKIEGACGECQSRKKGEGWTDEGNKYWKRRQRETQTVITNISGGDRKTSQIFNWFPSLLLLGPLCASFVFIVEIGGVRAEEAPIPSGLVPVRSYFRINPLFSSPHFVSKTY